MCVILCSCLYNLSRCGRSINWFNDVVTVAHRRLFHWRNIGNDCVNIVQLRYFCFMEILKKSQVTRIKDQQSFFRDLLD